MKNTYLDQSQSRVASFDNIPSFAGALPAWQCDTLSAGSAMWQDCSHASCAPWKVRSSTMLTLMSVNLAPFKGPRWSLIIDKLYKKEEEKSRLVLFFHSAQAQLTIFIINASKDDNSSKNPFPLPPACRSRAHRTIFTGKRRLRRAAVAPSPAPFFRY